MTSPLIPTTLVMTVQVQGQAMTSYTFTNAVPLPNLNSGTEANPTISTAALSAALAVARAAVLAQMTVAGTGPAATLQQQVNNHKFNG